MVDFFEKQFIVVAGKGGVGKTTVAIAIAHCAARRGKRTLLCLTNAPPRYNELLGGGTMGKDIRKVYPNFFVVNLDPVASREEYGQKILRNRMVHRFVFGSRIVKSFLDAVPGLAEWAMLGKATHHILNNASGRSEYDFVIFDSPATGHGLDVMGLPWAIASSVPTGRIRDEAKERIDLMSDPARCEILPVTIPEEMPVNEAIELVEELRRRDLTVMRAVINMVPGRDHRGLSDYLPDDGGDDGNWRLPVDVAVGRSRLRLDSVRRLESATGLALVELPFMGAGGLDESAVLNLARKFYVSVSLEYARSVQDASI